MMMLPMDSARPAVGLSKSPTPATVCVLVATARPSHLGDKVLVVRTPGVVLVRVEVEDHDALKHVEPCERILRPRPADLEQNQNSKNPRRTRHGAHHEQNLDPIHG